METQDRRAGVSVGDDQQRAVRGATGGISGRTRPRPGDRPTSAAVLRLPTDAEILRRVRTGNADQFGDSVVRYAALLLPGRLREAAVQEQPVAVRHGS